MPHHDFLCLISLSGIDSNNSLSLHSFYRWISASFKYFSNSFDLNMSINVREVVEKLKVIEIIPIMSLSQLDGLFSIAFLPNLDVPREGGIFSRFLEHFSSNLVISLFYIALCLYALHLWVLVGFQGNLLCYKRSYFFPQVGFSVILGGSLQRSLFH